MKQATVLLVGTFLLMVLCVGVVMAGDVKSAGVSGNWSAGATWIGGVVPGPTDIVTIADADVVTYDMTFTADNTIAGLIIGEGTSGSLLMTKTDSTKLIITGDLTIKTGAVLNAQTSSVPGGAQHLIILSGNYQCDGTMDARVGSTGSTLGVINFELVGTTNSTITFSTDPYTAPSSYEFNGMKINKSGNANVYLGSNILFATGSSSDAYRNANVTFVLGKVYTGDYVFATRSSTNATINGASDSSYVVGAMGRANSSAGANREWYIGDTKAYRPAKVRMTTGVGTGHYVSLRVIEGNANTGTSVLGSGIDKVHASRYYKLDYYKGTTSVTTIKVDRFTLAFGPNDGIADSSRNLRIAYSLDSLAHWTSLGPVIVPDTSIMARIPPRYFTSDSLATADNLTMTDVGTGGTSIYIAFARATGTIDNTLVGTTTGITEKNLVPSAYALSQNYPNPFNPSTNFSYQVGKLSFVSVKIYDVLGREVATLVNESKQAGTYPATWNATGFGSGIYFCKMQSGSFTDTKKILLVK